MLFATGIIFLSLAFMSAKKMESETSKIFLLLMLSIFLYSIGYGLELFHKDLADKLFWVKVEYAGIAFIPALWLMFAFSYTNCKKCLKKPFVILYLIIPILTFIFKITDEVHHLVYSTTHVVSIGQISTLVFTPGPWYYIHNLYMLITIIAGFTLLLKLFFCSPSFYRKQIIIVVIGALIPICTYFTYVFLNPFNNIDTVPFAFILTGFLLFFALSRFRLFELMSVSRSTILEIMYDGFMLIDNHGVIVDANRPLLHMLHLEKTSISGQFFEKTLLSFPEITSACRQDDADIKVSIGNERFYNIRTMPIKTLNNQQIGKLVILQDITKNTLIEKMLERNKQLRSILTKIATDFINVPMDKMDEAIDKTLATVGEFTRLDRLHIFHYNSDKRLASNTYEWCAKGITPYKKQLQEIAVESLPGFLLPPVRGETVYIPDVTRLPAGSPERTLMETENIKSLLTLPMVYDNECIGFVGMNAVRDKREFTENEIELLKLLAEIFTNAEMRKRNDFALKESENRYNLFFDNAPLGIVHTDTEGKIIKANSKFTAITGVPTQKIIGLNIMKSLIDPQMKQLITDALKGKTGSYQGRYAFVVSGNSAYVNVVAKGIFDGTKIVGTVFIFEDITDKKQIEQQLIYNALHDPLTNLANRALLFDRVERAILHTQRNPSAHFIFMFLDLDDFKKVNDSLGHMEGDNLLRLVAKKLAVCIRPEDTLARLGGDEFAILLEMLPETDTGTQIAQRIMSVMREPVNLSGRMFSITASMGICHSSAEITTPDEYLRNADMAMYKAKREGKNRFAYFSPSMHETITKKVIEETYLLEAVRNKKLSIYYQPIIELDSEKIVGYEALLRWMHPEKGLLMPMVFIPLAEETGLIVSIGEWVLEHACQQQWLKKEQNGRYFNLHINISARQLYSQDIVLKVKEILQTTKFPPECLCLEITESTLMLQSMVDILTSLKSLGIKLIIDDFGTGFSSLSYLHRYPIDSIKIDKAFIAGMMHSEKDAEIVKTIIAMGETLRMSVIAEGVETRQQADELKQLGCHFAQGFLWGAPSEKIETQKNLLISPIS